MSCLYISDTSATCSKPAEQQTCREKGGGRGVGEKLGACQSGSEEGQGVRGEGRAGGREGQGGGVGGALLPVYF